MAMAATLVTGISDEELKTLQEGGWQDDASLLPGWKRVVGPEGEDGGTEQWIYPLVPVVGVGWRAHCPADAGWVPMGSLDAVLEYCRNETPPGWVARPARGLCSAQVERFERCACRYPDHYPPAS